MGRLKSVPSRLSNVCSRLDQGARGPVSRDVRRYKEKPWRKWYSLKRWTDMKRARRKAVRDVCEQTGVLLIGSGNEWNSPVLDHIRPHHGDPVLFWDPSNVQLVSKQWHDGEKQRRERAGLE